MDQFRALRKRAIASDRSPSVLRRMSWSLIFITLIPAGLSLVWYLVLIILFTGDIRLVFGSVASVVSMLLCIQATRLVRLDKITGGVFIAFFGLAIQFLQLHLVFDSINPLSGVALLLLVLIFSVQLLPERALAWAICIGLATIILISVSILFPPFPKFNLPGFARGISTGIIAGILILGALLLWFYRGFSLTGKIIVVAMIVSLISTMIIVILIQAQNRYQAPGASLAHVESNIQASLAITEIILVLVLLVAVFGARVFSAPITRLIQTADQIRQGNLSVKAQVDSSDELGQLAAIINDMTSRLRQTISEREQTITERTREMTLASNVGCTLALEQDEESLLKLAVDLIRSTFDLYYTQIFLLDSSGRMLNLRAGSGKAGVELVRRGLFLPVNRRTINGQAVITEKPVLVEDILVAENFLSSDLLPETRSELVVPLIADNQVLGVLDLQSSKVGCFRKEHLPAYEVLAGQLAVAIENARQFDHAQRAQQDLKRQMRLFVQQSWDEYLNAISRSQRVGYLFNRDQLSPLAVSDQVIQSPTLLAGIELAGQRIGEIAIELPDGRQLTIAEQELVNRVAHQVARQVENLRLLAQVDHYRLEAERAAREESMEGWENYLQEQATKKDIAFVYDLNEVKESTDNKLLSNSITDPGKYYSQKLSIRGIPIGELVVEIKSDLDEQKAELIHTVSERLSEHLETLRLSEQTRRALAETEVLYYIIAEINEAENYDDILTALSQGTILTQSSPLLWMGVYDRPLGGSIQPQYIFTLAQKATAGHHLVGRYEINQLEIQPDDLFGSKPVFVKNIFVDRRFSRSIETLLPGLHELASGIVLPLMMGNQAIGFIMGFFDQPVMFTSAEFNRLAAITGQAAIAVQSRLLLEQARSRAQQEQLLREVTSSVINASDVDTIMRRAVEHIGHALGLPAYIYIGSPDPHHIDAEIPG